MTLARTTAQTILFATAAIATACGGQSADPRPQWVVDISTDAPVPQLGDRLLVELLAPDGAPACAGCRRLFGMPGPEAWPLSFGVPDETSAEVRLRVRLFRADRSDVGGAPLDGLTIDALARLERRGTEVRRVALTLATTCAGLAADVVRSRTCDPTTSELVDVRPLGDKTGNAPLPGSFAPAFATPCSRAPGEGMVCVEGGVFVRGNSAAVLDDAEVVKAAPERLVRVGPFALDRTETTVREMRALVAAGKVAAPRMRSPESSACTYTEAPGDFEDYPLSCVSRRSAARACEARGLRLPTEAEWEFAAGDGAQERRYPWGADPSVCRFAILGRGRSFTEGAIDLSSICRARPDGPPLPWGPRPVTEGEDVTASGLRHMGGNLSEWVADQAGAYDGPCGAGPPLLVDPRCDEGELGLVLVRGGSWMLPPYRAQSVFRGTYRTDDGTPEVGFRCAESM